MTPGAFSPVLGLVLAAGAGRRMGRAKALIRAGSGEPWLTLAARALLDGGCSEVVVTLGASGDDALPLVTNAGLATAVFVDDWASGMAASLIAGLAAAAETDAAAVAISLVDLPDLPSSVVRRIAQDADSTSLRQAVFGGRPGHPVVIGRQHWASLSSDLSGDEGARAYLVANGVDEIECGDLWDGNDVDGPIAKR